MILLATLKRQIGKFRKEEEGASEEGGESEGGAKGSGKSGRRR